jgi:hypothetical protein
MRNLTLGVAGSWAAYNGWRRSSGRAQHAARRNVWRLWARAIGASAPEQWAPGLGGSRIPGGVMAVGEVGLDLLPRAVVAGQWDDGVDLHLGEHQHQLERRLRQGGYRQTFSFLIRWRRPDKQRKSRNWLESFCFRLCARKLGSTKGPLSVNTIWWSRYFVKYAWTLGRFTNKAEVPI